MEALPVPGYPLSGKFFVMVKVRINLYAPLKGDSPGVASDYLYKKSY